MSEENEAAKEPDLAVIVGGVEVEVEHLPAEAFDEKTLERLKNFSSLLGTRQVVKVRHVPLSSAPRFDTALHYNDEATQIEIACGKDPGWADTLMPASVDTVADEALKLNLKSFGRRFDRIRKVRQLQIPEPMTKLQEQLATLQQQVADLLSRESATGSAGIAPS